MAFFVGVMGGIVFTFLGYFRVLGVRVVAGFLRVFEGVFDDFLEAVGDFDVIGVGDDEGVVGDEAALAVGKEFLVGL